MQEAEFKSLVEKKSKEDVIGCLAVAAVLGSCLALFTWGGGLTDFVLWALDPPPTSYHTPEVILNNRWSYVQLAPDTWVFRDEQSDSEYLAIRDTGIIRVDRRAER